jgi:hypothetical protein
MRTRTSSPTEVKTRVEAKIKRASEIEDHWRLLAYGRSGAGKTRLAATAPQVLLIDVNEHGTKSTRRDIDPWVYPVDYWQDINDAYWYLQSGDHSYLSYAIDGVTALQTLCMAFVLGDEASRDASRDPDMPTRQAWGKVGQLMKTQITNFRNLPMNGVYTALTRMRDAGEEDEDVVAVTGPAASPSVGGHLEAAVDTIGYLHTREVYVKRGEEKIKTVRRRLLVGPNERFVTKDRTHVLGEYVDAPRVDKMLELINGKEA